MTVKFTEIVNDYESLQEGFLTVIVYMKGILLRWIYILK